MKPPPLAIAALLLLAAGAVAVMISSTIESDGAPDAPRRMAPETALGLTPIPERAIGDIESYAAIWERPLFNAGRAADPPPEPTPAPETAAPAPPPAFDPAAYRLVGIVTDDKTRVAMVARQDGSDARPFRTGDAIDGWTISSITANEVTVEKSGITGRLRFPTPTQ